jgi:hypothetical protein
MMVEWILPVVFGVQAVRFTPVAGVDEDIQVEIALKERVFPGEGSISPEVGSFQKILSGFVGCFEKVEDEIGSETEQGSDTNLCFQTLEAGLGLIGKLHSFLDEAGLDEIPGVSVVGSEGALETALQVPPDSGFESPALLGAEVGVGKDRSGKVSHVELILVRNALAISRPDPRVNSLFPEERCG